MPPNLRRATVLGLGLALALLPRPGQGQDSTKQSQTPTTTPAEATRTECGQMAPDFTLSRVDGSEFSLREERGKLTLITFFATWCPDCLKELPHLQTEIFERFDSEHFSLIVVGREHQNAELSDFAKRREVDLPLAGDPTREVYARYAEHTIPRNVLVGPDGRVVFQSIGFQREDFDRLVELIEVKLRALDAS